MNRSELNRREGPRGTEEGDTEADTYHIGFILGRDVEQSVATNPFE